MKLLPFGGSFIYNIPPLVELWLPFRARKGTKAGVGQYPVRTNSVPNSVEGTSIRGWYGANRGVNLFW